ncbi:MAG: DUF819 family protein [Gemmatimonadetes bacterium]|nr:DUF819 family protein [Gemmatimonadota bacterium]
MIQDPLLVLAFMLGVVAFTRWLEERFDWVKKISSAVVCTLLGIALANMGVIAHTGPMHDAVFTFAIPYAIVLVIIGTDMRELTNAGRPMLIAYGAACFGSLVGGVASGAMMAAWVGPETWKLAGAFSAAFAGGGMNFAAVGQGLEMDASTFSAAAVADNLSTVPYLLAQVGLFGILSATFLSRSGVGASASEAVGEADEEAMRRRWTDTELNITDIAILGALPLLALWTARLLSGYLPAIPEVLWLTTMALVAAQLPWARKLRGAEVLSYFALHIFFIVLGAASVLSEVAQAGLPIFSFMIALLVIHVVVAYGIGWFARVDLATVSIASQAAIGGPGSALAIGMAMKWHKLVAPAVIVGIFGYALGNYLGFACAYIVRSLVG